MKIQSGSSGVVITPKEKSPDGALRVSVSTSVEGFTGCNRSAWIAPHALADFVKDLSVVCNIRKGQACLQSLSPEGFRFRIQITDLLGHASCDVAIAQKRAASGRWIKNVLSVEFEIDPSLLPKYLKEAIVLASYDSKPA